MPKWNIEEQVDNRDLAELQRIVFLDHLKTGCFGVIGASVFAPLFRGESVPWTSAFPIGVAGLFLVLMVIFANQVR
jgi:hypothetical protein